MIPGDWELHHDMVLEGDEGRIVALASDATDELNLEDMTIEVDLETGEVKEILDFKDIFSDYYENDASELTATDEFYLAGRTEGLDPSEHHPVSAKGRQRDCELPGGPPRSSR